MERPWAVIEDSVVAASARIVGARPSEVAVMNSLTANLHLLMVPFYRPTTTRFKIIIEDHAFPSDTVSLTTLPTHITELLVCSLHCRR